MKPAPFTLQQAVTAEPLTNGQLKKGIALLRQAILKMGKELDTQIEKKMIVKSKMSSSMHDDVQISQRSLAAAQKYNNRLKKEILQLEKAMADNPFEKAMTLEEAIAAAQDKINSTRNQLKTMGEEERKKMRKAVSQQLNDKNSPSQLVAANVHQRKRNQELKEQLKSINFGLQRLKDQQIQKQTIIIDQKQLAAKQKQAKQFEQNNYLIQKQQAHKTTFSSSIQSKIKLQQIQIKRLKKELKQMSKKLEDMRQNSQQNNQI